MSRKTNTLKALVVVGAVAGAAFGVAPAQASTPVVSKVSPLKAATSVASTVTISGKNFSSETVKGVRFQNAAETTCNATAVIVANSTTIYATKPDTGCVAGLQKVQLFSELANTTQVGTTFAGTATTTVTFVVPQAITSIAPRMGLSTGATTVKVVTSTTMPLTGVKATLGGKPLSAIKVASDGLSFTGKTPVGVPGDALLVVNANGVNSSAYPAAADTAFATKVFQYKRALRVQPNFTVVNPTDAASLAVAPAPVRIDTAGLPAAAAGVAVTFCGQAATVHTAAGAAPIKAPTATSVWVTPPAASSTGVGITQTDGIADGKACPVVLTVNAAGGNVQTIFSTYIYSMG